VSLIRWTTEASDQLEAAVKHIQQDNPTAARNVAQAVIDRIEQLATLSGLGRPGNPRTRHRALRRRVPEHGRTRRNPVHLARCAGLALNNWERFKMGDFMPLSANEIEASNRAEAAAMLIRAGYRVYRPEADASPPQ